MFTDPDHYSRFVSKLEKHRSETVEIGKGIHSLRACPLEEIEAIIGNSNDERPFHIHISEQVKEVEDFEKLTQQRPIAWMHDKGLLRTNTNLVHATHIDADEMSSIIKSGSSVVLCPNTEANLGDGIFPAFEYTNQGGKWSIGSDSHINLNAFEELRVLEYGQRLKHLKRNLIADTQTGDLLYHKALLGGVAAAGSKFTSQIEVGSVLNAIEVDLESEPSLTLEELETFLSSVVFTGCPHFFKQVYTNGKPRLGESGRHKNFENYLRAYKKSLQSLS